MIHPTLEEFTKLAETRQPDTGLTPRSWPTWKTPVIGLPQACRTTVSAYLLESASRGAPGPGATPLLVSPREPVVSIRGRRGDGP